VATRLQGADHFPLVEEDGDLVGGDDGLAEAADLHVRPL